MGRAELLSAAFSLVAFLVYSKSIGRSGKTGTACVRYLSTICGGYHLFHHVGVWLGSHQLLLASVSRFYLIFLTLSHYSTQGWSGIAVTIALVTCGMLCKEQGITVVGICLIYDLCVVNKVKRPTVYMN